MGHEAALVPRIRDKRVQPAHIRMDPVLPGTAVNLALQAGSQAALETRA